jgi:3-deoxy-D-manno-octulosonic-acid transferase
VILLAASTHAGEDEMILAAYLSAKIRYPFLKLVIAPRHIERAGSIERLIQNHSLSAVRYSAVSENGMGFGDILLIDEWGILNRLYQLCDLVFVGGSLVSKGGHNLAEVGLAERCILHGPYMQNFKEMAREFRSANASIQVRDEAELAQTLLRLVPNVQLRNQFGLGAKRVVLNNQGVTQKIVEETLKCLKTPFAVHPS